MMQMKVKIKFKKARLEQLEPMEIVNYYTRRYHQALDMLNTLPPSIEPFASGHIPEQIELIEEILIMVMHIFLMVQYILMSLNTRMILIYMAF